ncbi:MAG: amidohydrolase [Angelakisella sp.]
MSISLTPAQQQAAETVEDYRGLMQEVGDTLWGFAETGLCEYRSAAYLMELYRKNGFNVTGGLAGFPTGFMAEYKSGSGPVVALLCEYDALGGLSTAREGENGHGCGHNLFGAAATATAMLLKTMLQNYGIRGTVRVYGTPGEENYASKAYYVKHGLFDDVSCSVGFHAHDRNEVNFTASSGTIITNYIFRGKPAHAGNCPWEGVSALDAVEIMNVACNYLREHLRPEARVHYIITNGGAVTNVVPDLASSQYSVRAATVQYMDEIARKVDKCADAAALATGCTVEKQFIDKTYNTILLREYAELAQSYLELVGAPDFTEDERETAKKFGDGTGLDMTVAPLPACESSYGGASDEGDVSWVVPHVSIYVANVARGTGGHTLDFTRQVNMSAAYTAMVKQVKATALMLLHIFQSPEEAAALKAAHKLKLNGLKYPKNLKYTLSPRFNPNCEGVTVTDTGITVKLERLILLPKGFGGTVFVENNETPIAVFTKSGTVRLDNPPAKGDSLYIYACGDKKQLIGYYNV